MRPRTIGAPALGALLALAGCVTYRAAPLEALAVLEELETARRESLAGPADPDADRSLGPRELAALAVTANPGLAAARAEVGVRRALLVEAGLLPDPELSWDAMDVVASQIIDGTSTPVDVLAGAGLMFPLPRPGERSARIGAAEWQVEEARRQVAAQEWTLTRDVHVAYEDVRAAEVLVEQTRSLVELADSTREHFRRAREAGAATAIQANLALGELQTLRLDAVRAESRARLARQELNALLGLPPGVLVPLGPEEDPSDAPSLRQSAEELTAHAVESRPDLAALLAGYRAAEEELRLAVTHQFPAIAVGTGISLTLPIFSHFGRPEIETALARREQLRREFTAAVHAVRQEIAATHARWELAQQEVDLVENELLPNAEESLTLSRTAFAAGEATLLETLALQRALVQARTRSVEARAERSRRAWELLAASGGLLGPGTGTTPGEGERDEPSGSTTRSTPHDDL